MEEFKERSNKRARIEKNDEPTPILPPEVVIEILSRLPLKYLSQAQLVCKEWRAFIQNHYFIEKHMARSSVVHHWHNVEYSSSSNSRSERVSFCYMHGCDGLVILMNNVSHKYFLWNPAIFRGLELPDPRDDSYGITLHFVSATRNYRIVSIYKDRESGGKGCDVLTPGPSMSWRSLTFPDIVNANEGTKKQKVSVVSVGGAVHCVLVTKVGEESVAEIVTLDVETECFTVNHLPNGLFHDMGRVRELDWDGKLAFADIVGESLQLMELEDYKKQRWCEEKKIIPLPFMKDSGFEGNIFTLFNRKGDIWFWLENEKIFFYTIKTGKITHVKHLKAFFLENNFYSYKPSLVSFEGMQPDADLEYLRPKCLELD